MTASDTPRVDAAAYEADNLDIGHRVVQIAFARELERALAVKEKECEELRHDIARAVQTNAELATEIAEARQDAERLSAMNALALCGKEPYAIIDHEKVLWFVDVQNIVTHAFSDIRSAIDAGRAKL